jgi:hypothetical protein
MSECKLEDAQHGSCLQLLHVQYSDNTASILFEATPGESLVLSNRAQVMINETTIWLDKIKFDRKIQIYCRNSDACKADIIKDIYAESACLF